MNNFSLYIWGFVMIMIDFYDARNMLLSSDQVDEQYSFNPDQEYWNDPNDYSWTYYGEQNLFPQFVR